MRFRPTSLLLAALLAVAGATPALGRAARPASSGTPPRTSTRSSAPGTAATSSRAPSSPFGMALLQPREHPRRRHPHGRARRVPVRRHPHPRLQPHPHVRHGCAGGSGDIPFFPYPGEVTSSPASDTEDAVYAADFSHADETAEPGHYKVGLASGVTADLTATARTGYGRFTYPAGKPASLLIRTANSEVGSTGSAIEIDPATRTVSGSVTSGNFCGYLDPEGQRAYYTLHFTARFDRDFRATGTWQDDRLSPGSTSASGGTGGFANGGRPVAGKGAGRIRRVRARPRSGRRQGRHLVRQPGRRRGQPRRGEPAVALLRLGAGRGPRGLARTAGRDPGRRRHGRRTHHLLHRALPLAPAPERHQRRRPQIPGRRRHGTPSPAATAPSTAPSPAGTSTATRCSCSPCSTRAPAPTSPSRCTNSPGRTAASGTAGCTARAAPTS